MSVFWYVAAADEKLYLVVCANIHRIANNFMGKIIIFANHENDQSINVGIQLLLRRKSLAYTVGYTLILRVGKAQGDNLAHLCCKVSWGKV